MGDALPPIDKQGMFQIESARHHSEDGIVCTTECHTCNLLRHPVLVHIQAQDWVGASQQ